MVNPEENSKLETDPQRTIIFCTNKPMHYEQEEMKKFVEETLRDYEYMLIEKTKKVGTMDIYESNQKMMRDYRSGTRPIFQQNLCTLVNTSDFRIQWKTLDHVFREWVKDQHSFRSEIPQRRFELDIAIPSDEEAYQTPDVPQIEKKLNPKKAKQRQKASKVKNTI